MYHNIEKQDRKDTDWLYIREGFGIFYLLDSFVESGGHFTSNNISTSV